MEGHLVLESVEQWVWVLENKPRLHNCLHFCVLQVWEHQLGVVYLVGVTEISTCTVCLIRLPAIKWLWSWLWLWFGISVLDFVSESWHLCKSITPTLSMSMWMSLWRYMSWFSFSEETSQTWKALKSRIFVAWMLLFEAKKQKKNWSDIDFKGRMPIKNTQIQSVTCVGYNACTISLHRR